ARLTGSDALITGPTTFGAAGRGPALGEVRAAVGEGLGGVGTGEAVELGEPAAESGGCGACCWWVAA
ncbi:MAG TPA: hypothetical protein VN712_00935, partial [Dermatophilaceae bacterium]|nr:hypothetical protein [Dermatophilaceae bacterium]